jgi:hypothetical protein
MFTNQCIIRNSQRIIIETLYKRLTRLQILLLISYENNYVTETGEDNSKWRPIDN